MPCAAQREFGKRSFGRAMSYALFERSPDSWLLMQAPPLFAVCSLCASRAGSYVIKFGRALCSVAYNASYQAAAQSDCKMISEMLLRNVST